MPRVPSRPSGAPVLRLSAALYYSGIASFHSFYYANWPYRMAAAVTAIAPILLIFFIAQRYFVRGIQLTGLK